MADVKVYNIEALKLFRERLATFGEDAKNALISVDMDTRRTVDFILREQPMHWKAQLKKRNEALQQAKAELFRRKLAETTPGSLDDTAQKEAVRRAEMRVQEAEQKLEKIKKWATPLMQATEQYHGQSRALDDMVGPQLERALAQLAAMIDALEKYTGTAQPPASGGPS
jgi:hypothetical protein